MADNEEGFLGELDDLLGGGSSDNAPPVKPPSNPADPSLPAFLQKCPLCGGPMVERMNKQKGDKFLGCKKFPACRGTRSYQ